MHNACGQRVIRERERDGERERKRETEIGRDAFTISFYMVNFWILLSKNVYKNKMV